MLRPVVAGVLVLVALACPASAQDPRAAVAQLARDARTSGDVFAFLRGLGGLGDVDLDRAALAAALRDAGPAARHLLGATRRLTVRDGRVELTRDDATTAALDGAGHLAAGARVRAAVGDDGALSGIEGLRVGPRADALGDVRSARFADGQVHVTAGPPGAERTAKLRVSPGLAASALASAPAPAPSPAPSRGLRGALEGEEPGAIDVSRHPASAKRYKRRAGSRRADVAARTLPVVELNGRRFRPVGFESGMAIDADGAGDAHRGDGSGQSSTSLAWSHRRGHERYLDPTVTPFVALPIGFERDHPGVRLGDIVAVQRDGRTAYAIYGDRGPRDQLGEGSIALGRLLGLTSAQLDPNRGGVERGVTYVVFPGSGTGRPLSNEEIQARGERLHRATLAAQR